MGEEVLLDSPSELTPSDLEDVEPEEEGVEPGYDFERYVMEDGTVLMLRDNSSCVWERREDDFLYCVETGRDIMESRTEVGQNDMGDVITRMRPGCPYHEPDGPNDYTGSFDHRDVWSLEDMDSETEVAEFTTPPVDRLG